MDAAHGMVGYTLCMNARSKRLLDEVLELPTEERNAFAAELLENIEAPPDTRSGAEWAAEIDRRAKEALDPNWKGHSWEEVRADVQRSLRDSRGE